MIFSRFEWMVALRYLRARRQEGFISVIAGFSFFGIMLGVATLIIVMAVMNGFREELLGRILGFYGHFFVYEKQSHIQEYETLVQSLTDIPTVTRVLPVINAQALLTAREQATGAIVRGMRPQDIQDFPLLSQSIRFGDKENFTTDQVGIGVHMAQRLHLHVGDRLTLIAPQGKATVFGTMPRLRTYKVAFIFDVGMYEYDNNVVLLSLSSAQVFFRMSEAVSRIELYISSPNEVTNLREHISQILGDKYSFVDWQQRNSSFINALYVERNVMFLILTLIILVAAFNIVSSLIMLVKDKSKDIAILRTMGATRGMMVRIFLLTGSMIGFGGTLLGLILGVAFCENIESIRQLLQSLSGVELFSEEIYFLSTIPAEMHWQEVLQVIGMSLFLSFSATMYPAWRASRLDPVEVLRYE